MQPHPIPQNITGFEFKLIGNLTLRQFGYVGVAAILNFILYSAKLPLLVILIIGGPVSLLALALAFLPVNDQPFERWFVSLIKTFYSPSVRVWHREAKSIGFLEPQFATYLHRQVSFDQPRVVSDRSKLDRYLKQNKPQKQKSLVDINEESRLAQLSLSIPQSLPQVFNAQSATLAGVADSPLSTSPTTPNIGVNQGALPRLKRMAEVVESSLVNRKEKEQV